MTDAIPDDVMQAAREAMDAKAADTEWFLYETGVKHIARAILAEREKSRKRVEELEADLAETMNRTVPYHSRRRAADVRWMVTWLHQRATWMRDPRAKAILNSAAFDLGGLSKFCGLREPSNDAAEDRALLRAKEQQ